MLLQDPNSAYIQGIGFSAVIVAIFLVLTILLLRRSKNRLTLSLTYYFISLSVGLCFNIFYRSMELAEIWTAGVNDQILIILNITTTYFVAFAGIHLLNFILLLYFSSRIFTSKKQIVLIIAYGVVLLGLYILGALLGYVEWVGAFPDDVPKWDWPFFAYGIIVSQIVFIFIIIFTVRITKKMGTNKYSMKFRRNIIGMLLFDIQLIGAFLANTIATGTFRFLGTIIQIICIIPAAFFLYFGLKKEPEI